MLKTILRKEHKNKWERRVALTPDAVSELNQAGFLIAIEPSEFRVFDDESYVSCGSESSLNLADYELILGIKEPPVDSIQKHQTHLCFSHTIKGQDYNMPLLQKFIDQKATLIDYELMMNESGIRTIAFGRYAGIGGAIDTLWLYGQMLAEQGINSVLSEMKQTWEYQSLANAQRLIEPIDINQDKKPLRVVILGNGKVGMGAAEVCRWLNLPEISAQDISEGHYDDEHHWFSVLDVTEMYGRIEDGGFDRDEYTKEGKTLYRSRFKELLTHCDVVLQSSFWTDHYPRHMDADDFRKNADILPAILGDISCDIDGSFVCTKKITDIENPVYRYHPETEEITDGLEGEGMAVMAIDNLPCELPADASSHFSNVLSVHLPALMQLDFDNDFESLPLIEELKNAVIVYRGELTPNFQYLKRYLST